MGLTCGHQEVVGEFQHFFLAFLNNTQPSTTAFGGKETGSRQKVTLFPGGGRTGLRV